MRFKSGSPRVWFLPALGLLTPLEVDVLLLTGLTSASQVALLPILSEKAKTLPWVVKLEQGIVLRVGQ